jgi:prophage maintenance system killer protein
MTKKKTTPKSDKVFNNNVIVYQTKSGALELKGDFTRETVWATLDQISEVFGRDKSVISRHFKNIFDDKELEKDSVVAKNATTAADGKTYQVEYYNLDAILSVGYRVNSKTATLFRQWATKTLREHLTKGYTLNKKVILKNYDQFLKNVSDIQALLPEHVTLDPKGILDLVKEYSSTWSKLDAYDKDELKPEGVSKKKIKINAEELSSAIETFKTELARKGEATEIFAQERSRGNLEGILGNVLQSFGGADVYATLEEKASHLLYFMVKNHPFVDGNKRSGAFTFIWFLRKSGVRGAKNINPSGLTAITLLIAESDPKHKDKVVALVVELLKTKN